MGQWDHRIPPSSDTLFKGELATRLLVYAAEVGLGVTQLTEVTEVIREWREEYIAQGASLVAKAHEVYVLYDERIVDTAAVALRMDEYTALYNRMIRDCMTATARIAALLTDTQFAALKAIHDSEGAILPFRQWP
jgi:hypothetical protein